MSLRRQMDVTFVGTYPPRRCGIATFTRDLATAMPDAISTAAIAIDRLHDGLGYPAEVIGRIEQDQRGDYGAMAHQVNNSADIVSVQHEFGIFGGCDGDWLLEFAAALDVPLVTTAHTVLRSPSDGQRAVMEALSELSARIVVMNSRGRRFLVEHYGIPRSRVKVIPHGIPDLPYIDPAVAKPRLGLEGRSVISTFGLLAPSKGIEWMLEALPCIVSRVPKAVYVIAGLVHPGLGAEGASRYRAELESLAEERGVSEHVLFLDRYLSTEELQSLLLATEVYVTPYPSEEQISSGTLSYALGSGTAVVSTPYWHATELLADGRGVLVPFRDPDVLAREVSDLLTDHERWEQTRCRAYAHSRTMTWEAVGRQYASVFGSVADGADAIAELATA